MTDERRARLERVAEEEFGDVKVIYDEEAGSGLIRFRLVNSSDVWLTSAFPHIPFEDLDAMDDRGLRVYLRALSGHRADV